MIKIWYFICCWSNGFEALLFIYKFILILFYHIIFLRNYYFFLTILLWVIYLDDCSMFLYTSTHLYYFTSPDFNPSAYNVRTKITFKFFRFEVKASILNNLFNLIVVNLIMSLLFTCKLHQKKILFRNTKDYQQHSSG